MEKVKQLIVKSGKNSLNLRRTAQELIFIGGVTVPLASFEVGDQEKGNI